MGVIVSQGVLKTGQGVSYIDLLGISKLMDTTGCAKVYTMQIKIIELSWVLMQMRHPVNNARTN